LGVNPRSLSFEVAKAAAVGCKKILTAAKFLSVFTWSVGVQLLNHLLSVDPTADIRSPFTGALGVLIAPRNTPPFEGGQSNRVFFLTARHVPLPPSVHHNELYERKMTSQPRHEVLILSSNTQMPSRT
jgi:hypothetical protein